MRMTSVFSLAVAALLWMTVSGCEKGTNAPKQVADDHSHVHGPNGGEIIELSEEEYHGELLRDMDEKVTRIFVLDKNAKNHSPIAAEAVVIRMIINSNPTEFKLPAKPLSGEAAGNSSRFESDDKSLHLALDNQTAERELEIKHGEKSYKGKFEYYEPHDHGHAHQHEDHDHDHDHDHEKETKETQPKN